MMQAITTKFIGPTNYRGSRIVAQCEAKKKTYNWDYSLSVPDNHAKAAMLLVKELGWEVNGESWHGGGTKNGYVFVNACGSSLIIDKKGKWLRYE